MIGPQQVPEVADEGQARAMPELAVLSVIAHGAGPRATAVGRAALTAAASLDEERAALYADFVLAYLGEAARRALEAEMGLENYEFQSDFAKRFIAKGRAEGRAEGRVDALLAVLEARGLHPSDEERARIEECSDLEQLQHWIQRSINATTVEDIFEG